jgi:hypothetical protein
MTPHAQSKGAATQSHGTYERSADNVLDDVGYAGCNKQLANARDDLLVIPLGVNVLESAVSLARRTRVNGREVVKPIPSEHGRTEASFTQQHFENPTSFGLDKFERVSCLQYGVNPDYIEPGTVITDRTSAGPAEEIK